MRLGLLAVLLCASCSSSGDDAPLPPCADGTSRIGETCVPRFDTCAEGELPKFGGGCVAIGPECGEGFRRDGPASCAPILPKDACPAGKIAVPGDETCRDLGDCGSGTFGNLPDEAGAKWVDAAAAEGGDGSRGKPFRTLAAALDAVRSDGFVGLAAGKYEVNVDIDKPVRIQGRCASMVELHGADALTKDHVFQLTDEAIAIRDVAITGPYIAVGVYDADVTLERVWIHDTGFTAVESLAYFKPPRLRIVDSIVERGTQTGVFIGGGAATLERSVVRGTRFETGGKAADGVAIKPRTNEGKLFTTSLTVRGSLFDRNLRQGLSILGGALDADGLVIVGPGTATARPGLLAQDAPEVPKSTILLRHGWFSGSTRVQVSIRNSDATVEHVVATGGVAEADGNNGGGLYFGPNATFTLRSSLVEKTPAWGVVTEGAVGSIDGLVVRDIQAPANASASMCVEIAREEATSLISKVTLGRSLLQRCPQAGLLVVGSEAEVSEVSVLDIQQLDGIFGDGLAANTIGAEESPLVARLTVDKSQVLRAARAGVTVFGADLSIHDTRLACNGIDLNVETDYATRVDGSLMRHPFTLDTNPLDVCGCGTEVKACRGQSVGLRPVGG